MPGYVSRESADRWNHAARIVAGGGAGSHFVKGKYRPPRGGVEPCEDIPPGSYPAVAGATIAAGEIGQILITRCDSTLILSAANHTNCTFYAGDLITAIVDDCCVVRFTGCKCDCTEPEDNCCDKLLFICVDGNTYPVSMTNGRWVTFGFGTFNQDFSQFPVNPSDCCVECEPIEGFTAYGSFLDIFLTCNENTITAVATYRCNYHKDGTFSEGNTFPLKTETYNWSDLCGESPVSSITETFEYLGCSFDIVASFDLTTSCAPCGGAPPSPTGCCAQSLYFCINDDSRLMPVVGGDETWDVSDCCDCTTATVRLRTFCSNGSPSVQVTYTCDGVSSTNVASLNEFCTGSDFIFIPISSFQCFIRVQVSVANLGCDACIYCCDETRFLCINNVTEQLALDGGSDSWDVSDCCPDCTSATLTVTLSCNPITGTYVANWSLVCDGGSAETGFDAFSCTATSSVLNINATACILQMLITTTNIGCDACEGGATTTEPPPPPGP